MKTRRKIFLICLIVIFAFYVLVTSLGPGSVFALFSPASILYFPSILMQLIANEGNGIVCVDACGPCSVWGYQYILIDGQCVLPSVDSCKLLEVPGEWAFDEWTCKPVCKRMYQENCAYVENYIDEEIKTQKFSDEQIDRIFKRCDYQKMMDDRNWIGFDGNKITDHQPLYVWDNSTHHLDNNTCEWQKRK